MQYHLHIPFAVQDEKSGRPWLHQAFHFPDEVVADPNRGRDGDGGAGASDHSANGRTGDWNADYQACKKSHHTAAQDVGSGRELLAIAA